MTANPPKKQNIEADEILKTWVCPHRDRHGTDIDIQHNDMVSSAMCRHCGTKITIITKLIGGE